MPFVKSNDTLRSRLIPFGLDGQTKPQHYREMLGVLWENRSELPYAWNILNHGVCDGCSLGPYGLRDNVLDGVHLCMSRLKLLKLNTMAALELSTMNDVNRLRGMEPEQLRSLGRLSHPMVRRKGERGFLRVSWQEALDVVCKSIHNTAPHEMSFFGTDLLVIFGSDLPNNQPVTAKYMHYAKKAGTRIVVVNPMRVYGLERYWLPSVASSAVFGTELMDDFFQVGSGGDIAFINGVLKTLIANDQLDRKFIARHTALFSQLKTALDQQSWEMLEQRSGLTRADMQRFAILYGQARTAVIVYSIGLTQQEFGVDNVKAVVNLALARGMLGREKCGIMPIRSHSGVQGGGECGAEPDKLPGGFAVSHDSARRFSNLWHHPVPSNPGLKAPAMIEAAHNGEIKFLYSIGGDLLESMSDARYVAEALSRVPVRVHQDIVLNTSMLLDAEDIVIILPGQTRYEQRSGGTSTSTERRIRFTPEIPGHKIGETLPQWEIPILIGRKSMPNGDKLFPFNDTQAIREEMSRVMPIYQGIEKLTREGDQLQWGGPRLFSEGFTAMPLNRALFTALEPPDCRAEPVSGEPDYNAEL